MPYGGPACDTVALVGAELAADEVLHGRVSGRDFELRPKRDHDVDVLRVEVSDMRPTRPAFSESMAEGPAGP